MHTRTAIPLTVAFAAVALAISFGIHWLAQDACLDLGGALLAGNICAAEGLSPQPLLSLVRPLGAVFAAVVAVVFIGAPVYWVCSSLFPRGSEHV
jgi:hypothetical protein